MADCKPRGPLTRAARSAAIVLILASQPALADEMPDHGDVTAPASRSAVDAPADDPLDREPEVTDTLTASERAERIASIVIDIPFVRLAAFAYLGIGSVYFAATAPFTAPAGRLGEAFEYLVQSPYDYAVRRPIGRL